MKHVSESGAVYKDGPRDATYFSPSLPYSIGLDYGANSVRALVADCDHGREVGAVLVHGHGPFAWGSGIAEMAMKTLQLNPHVLALAQPLIHKHFLRKHGANAHERTNHTETHFVMI